MSQCPRIVLLLVLFRPDQLPPYRVQWSTPAPLALSPSCTSFPIEQSSQAGDGSIVYQGLGNVIVYARLTAILAVWCHDDNEEVAKSSRWSFRGAKHPVGGDALERGLEMVNMPTKVNGKELEPSSLALRRSDLAPTRFSIVDGAAVVAVHNQDGYDDA